MRRFFLLDHRILQREEVAGAGVKRVAVSQKRQGCLGDEKAAVREV